MTNYKFVDKTQPLPEDRKSSTSLYYLDKDFRDFAKRYMERMPIEGENEGDLEKSL